MPNRDRMEIVCILDRSASMAHIVKGAAQGFNAFIDSQRRGEGEIRLTLALFHNNLEWRYEGADLGHVRPLRASVFESAGRKYAV